jgi:hypothetical protein
MKLIYTLLLIAWAVSRLAAQHVTQIEYFIDDTDKGHGKNATIAVANGEATHTIPLTNVTPGFHLLYLRARNADNKWGVTMRRAIFVEKQPRPVNITRFEYYYVGSAGTPSATHTYAVNPPAPAVDLTFPGVTQGLVAGQKYTLYLWAYSATGERSLVNATTFTYSECANVPKPRVSILDGTVNVSEVLTLTCDQTGVAYQWLLNGNPISGATQKNYPVKAADFGAGGAAFSVRTTQASGCQATSDPLAVTATENPVAAAPFRLFPNPARDQLTIAYTAGQPARAVQAYVFNALGGKTDQRALQRKAGNTWETTLFTGSYAPGPYLIWLEDGVRSVAKPFVKQ